MDTSEIIVLIGLVINIGLTVWNSIRLKEIEEYKADFDRTNRKISYIQQTIRDLSEKEDLFFDTFFDKSEELSIEMINFNRYYIRHVTITKGIVDSIVPILGTENQKRVKNLFDDFENQYGEYLDKFLNSNNTEVIHELFNNMVASISGLISKITRILQDELNDLLGLEK